MQPIAKKRVKFTLAHICLIIASIFFLVPFIWLVSTSLKPITQIFSFPPEWIPSPFRWQNYLDAMEYIPFFTYLNNTVVITIISTIGVIISCPLVAYSFAKLQWKGRNVFFIITIAVMMIPGQVTMIPLFLLFNKIGWVGTPLPLIVPAFFGAPFYIFLLRQFFMGLPDTLRDSAKIDGAGEFRRPAALSPARTRRASRSVMPSSARTSSQRNVLPVHSRLGRQTTGYAASA